MASRRSYSSADASQSRPQIARAEPRTTSRQHGQQMSASLEALTKRLSQPELKTPLAWGAACASVGALHAYHSLFAAVPRPKTRVLRSLDVGVVVFAISSTLAFYRPGRPDD